MDRINRVGIELEGGWYSLPTSSRYQLRDDTSVVIENPHNYSYIGEIISPPLKIDETALWIQEHYPNGVNKTCGLHVHISLRSRADYHRLTKTSSFMSQLIDRITNWGKSKNLPKNHILWQRLKGKNNYCKLEWNPEAQMMSTRKEKIRYSAINFCLNLHGTVEFRILPMFGSSEIAVSAVQEIISYVNDYLSECKNTIEIGYTREEKIGYNRVKIVQKNNGLEISLRIPDLSWLSRLMRAAHDIDDAVCADNTLGCTAYYVDPVEDCDSTIWADRLESAESQISYDSHTLGNPDEPHLWPIWSPEATSRGKKFLIPDLLLSPSEIDTIALEYIRAIERLSQLPIWKIKNKFGWLPKRILNSVKYIPKGTKTRIEIGDNVLQIRKLDSKLEFSGHCPAIITDFHTRAPKDQRHYYPNRIYLISPDRPSLMPLRAINILTGQGTAIIRNVRPRRYEWPRILRGYKLALTKYRDQNIYRVARESQKYYLSITGNTTESRISIRISSNFDNIYGILSHVAFRYDDPTIHLESIGNSRIVGFIDTSTKLAVKTAAKLGVSPEQLGYSTNKLWETSPETPYVWPILASAWSDGKFYYKLTTQITRCQADQIVNAWESFVERL